jgi:hypothetical protein
MEILRDMSGSFLGRNDEIATFQGARRKDSQSRELSPDGNLRHEGVVGWVLTHAHQSLGLKPTLRKASLRLLAGN